MSIVEKSSLYLIKFARKYFRNTWVHRIPVTSWVYRKLFTAVHKPQEKVVNFRGNNFVVHTKDTSMVPSIINQDYESFELDLLPKLLKPGMVFIDIGANLGIYSVIASQLVGNKGKVFAFEPVPENFDLLSRNLKLNKVTNAQAIKSAISNKNGSTKIYLMDGSIGTHSLGGKSKNSITIPTQTLDSFLSANKVKPDFIKMDIEGYEGHALVGARKTLSSKRTILLMEFAAKLIKQSGDEPEQVAKTLTESFKHCYVIDERRKTLSRTTDYKMVSGIENGNLLLTNSPIKY